MKCTRYCNNVLLENSNESKQVFCPISIKKGAKSYQTNSMISLNSINLIALVSE